MATSASYGYYTVTSVSAPIQYNSGLTNPYYNNIVIYFAAAPYHSVTYSARTGEKSALVMSICNRSITRYGLRHLMICQVPNYFQ